MSNEIFDRLAAFFPWHFGCQLFSAGKEILSLQTTNLQMLK